MLGQEAIVFKHTSQAGVMIRGPPGSRRIARFAATPPE